MTTEEKKDRINQTGRAWLVAILATIAAIIISANNTKIPATATLLLPAMGIDVGNMSVVMSLSGYVGLVCALVAGGIVFKLGARKAATIVLIVELIGAVICAATSTYEMLFIGRIFEGVGFGCIAVIVPVLISEWFPPSKRGIPNGIFSAWIPLGGIFILSTSGLFFDMSNPDSYHTVFWFAAILVAVILVLWIVAVRNPDHSYLADEQDPNAPKPKLIDGFKSLPCWAGLLAFAGFALGTATVNNLSPTFFSMSMGLDQTAANNTLNIANIAVIIGSVGIGLLMNKVVDTSKRLILLIVSSVLLALCFVLTYSVDANTLVPWLIAFGLFNGMVPPIYFTMVADIAPRPELASVAATLIACGQALGGILFGFAGAAIGATGWGTGTMIMIAVAIVLVLGSVILIVSMKSRARKMQQQ